MKQYSFLLGVLLSVGILTMNMTLAATRTWDGSNSTNWSTAANWAENAVPVAGDAVTIPGGMPNQPAITASSSCASLAVNSGATLTLGAFAFTVSGSTTVSGTLVISSTTGTKTFTGGLTFNSGGTYRHAVNGGTIPTATWNANSTCEVTGATSSIPSGLTQTFGNFTWNCASQSSDLSFSGDLATVNGTFNMVSSSSRYLRLSGNGGGTENYANFNQTGGTLYVTNGSGGGVLNIAGNFSQIGGTLGHSGTGSSTINFNGSGTQTYTGGGTRTGAIEWVVNKSSGSLNLGSDMSLTSTDTLTLTAGVVSTGSYKINVTRTSVSGVLITGGSIDGTIQRVLGTSGGTYLFNSANTYLIPTFSGTPTFAITAAPGSSPANQDPTRFYLRRTYALSVVSGSITSSTVRLGYADSELDPALESDLELGRYSGSGTTWTWLTSTRDAAANWVQATGVTTFSTWGISSDTPLPIQLASFVSSRIADNMIRLEWNTVSEMNNYGFFIERRSEQETAFIELPGVFIPGHGTTLEPQSYGWVDNDVTPGVWYYRLRQVDLDGTVNYSDEVRTTSVTGVPAAAPKEFALLQNYPNPFNPTTEIKFSVAGTGRTSLELFNVAGQKVATLFDDVADAGHYYSVRLDGAGLASGLYLYRLTSGAKTELKKMMLLK
jgi:hypothetical protein